MNLATRERRVERFTGRVPTCNKQKQNKYRKNRKKPTFFKPETETDPDQKPTFEQKTDPDPDRSQKVNPEGL
jgi:hypothetical protein